MCLSAPSNTHIKRRPSNLLPSTHSVLSTILGGLSSSHACVPHLVLAHRSRGPISCHVLDLAIGPLFAMPLAAAVSRLFGTVLPHGLVAASLVRCVRLSASECSDTVWFPGQTRNPDNVTCFQVSRSVGLLQPMPVCPSSGYRRYAHRSRDPVSCHVLGLCQETPLILCPHVARPQPLFWQTALRTDSSQPSYPRCVRPPSLQARTHPGLGRDRTVSPGYVGFRRSLIGAILAGTPCQLFSWKERSTNRWGSPK